MSGLKLTSEVFLFFKKKKKCFKVIQVMSP